MDLMKWYADYLKTLNEVVASLATLRHLERKLRDLKEELDGAITKDRKIGNVPGSAPPDRVAQE